MMFQNQMLFHILNVYTTTNQMAQSQIFIHIPRLHTAIAEWLFSLVFILVSNRRFKKQIHYPLLFVWLGVFIGYQELAGIMPISLWIPFMVGAVGLMFLFVFTMTEQPILRKAFITFQAFILAEFAASLEWQFYYYFFMNASIKYPKILEYFVMVSIYALVFALVYIMEKRHKARDIKIVTSKTDLFTAFSITVTIFAISNISFTGIDTPISGRYPQDVFYIRTLVDALGVVLFYAIREYKLATYSRMEVIALENLLNKQYSQYLQFKESNELVNRRYHDLKHQIAVIRSESEEKRSKYLAELEEELHLYDLQYKTGNRALDILLSSKSGQIADNNINFTVVADGASVDFISVMDMCSMLGNALDNAIEEVKEIDNEDERIIKLAIFQQQSFLLVRLENYYKSELIFEDGTYHTTKKDKRLHGYGLKSIKTVVEKYHGTIGINTENNWFTVIILIPIPKK
jgi:hypothetical protein